MTIGGYIQTARVKLGLDWSEYRKGIKEVQKETKKTSETVEDTSDKIDKTTKKAGKTFRGVGNVFGVVSGKFKKTNKDLTGLVDTLGQSATMTKTLSATIGAGIAAVVGGLVVSVAKKLYQSIGDLVAFARPDKFVTATKELQTAVANLKAVAGTVLAPMFEWVTHELAKIVNLLSNTGYQLASAMGFKEDLQEAAESANSLRESLMGFDKLNVATTEALPDFSEMEQAGEDFGFSVADFIPALSAVKMVGWAAKDVADIVDGDWNAVTDRWGDRLEDRWQSIQSAGITAWEGIKRAGNSAVAALQSKLRGNLARWDGVADGLVSAFTSAGTKIKGVFEGIWSSISEGFKTPANVIIDGVNALISGYNNSVGKIKIGDIGMPTLAEIPRLAQGGIVEPNQPFIVGDNKREREAVAPLSELMAMITSAVTNARSQPIEITVPLKLDGRELARATYQYNKNESARRVSSLAGRRQT